MSRSVNFKCKGPEVETSLANGKAARKPVAERDWTGLGMRTEGVWSAREQGLRSSWTSRAMVSTLNLFLTAALSCRHGSWL